ncbi:hypothetical protein Pa4123_82230 [Phytohabitans aurantiacus]|uniref:Uncharacterized protein n=1 Tax=Phytohabitans aurantiacus TaxID=3016789 RepID=A0ABQ5RAD7_9ACTN|nr:hypothetical protein Pa4123_82230 [Phytohabitans aurantiacus]
MLIQLDNECAPREMVSDHLLDSPIPALTSTAHHNVFRHSGPQDPLIHKAIPARLNVRPHVIRCSTYPDRGALSDWRDYADAGPAVGGAVAG